MNTNMRTLVAMPVFNEERYVRGVLERVLSIHPDVLVIDDGSRDQTARILPDYAIHQIRHRDNVGYGASMRDAFRFAIDRRFDWVITMDCDEQHEPAAIPRFIEAAEAAMSTDGADVISGSRYLDINDRIGTPPADRRSINEAITAEINCRFANLLGTTLTDAFCGFKAYRVSALRSMRPTVRGYAFPMQFWVQAAARRLRVRELPVRLIYNDPNRTFGAVLDDPAVRLRHYRKVMHREMERWQHDLPRSSLMGVCVPWPSLRTLISPADGARVDRGPCSPVAGRDADVARGSTPRPCEPGSCSRDYRPA
jgi:dolichol-phosphate mannosyltransferase